MCIALSIDLLIQAFWLGGSYVNTASEPLSGELTVPLANGVQLKLDMSKVALPFFSIPSVYHSVDVFLGIRGAFLVYFPGLDASSFTFAGSRQRIYKKSHLSYPQCREGSPTA